MEYSHVAGPAANHGTAYSAVAYAEPNKSGFAANSVCSVSGSGMQTPVSLCPRARVPAYAADQHWGRESSTAAPFLLESGPALYGQLFDDSDITIGHFAGAIALMWLTPRDNVKNILLGDQSLANVSLNLSTCFLRYTKYLVKTARIPSQLLTLALFYIMRFRQQCPAPVAGSASSEARLLVTALMIADKYEDDVSYNTTTWAKLSNIKVEELKKMEIEFLVGLNFKLRVSPDEWEAFGRYLNYKLFPVIDRLASR